VPRTNAQQSEAKTTAVDDRRRTAAHSSKAASPRYGLDCPRKGPALLWLVIVLAAAAAILSYQAVIGKFDRQLHVAVTERMQEFFPKASLYIGRVAYNNRGDIVINDLRMAIKSDATNKLRRVLNCERAVLVGDLDIAHFIQQTITVKQLDLFGVQLEAWPQANGTWSIEELKPQTVNRANSPIVVIHKAMLKVNRDNSARSPVTVIHDIEGRIAPVSQAEAAASSPSALSVNLSASSSGLMERVSMQGWLDALHGTWNVAGKVNQFAFTHELIENLPPQVTQYLVQLAGLECEASFSYEVFSRPRQSPGFSVRDGQLTDGRLQDERLPYPLDNLNGQFFCDNSMLQLRGLSATSGSTTLELDTDIEGFTLDVPISIHAKAENLELDRRLYDSLPAVYQTYWDRLKLEGTVNASVRLMFDGKKLSTKASCDCRNISMTPWLFPYPLENVTGRVEFEDGRVSSELLSGLAGGQPVAGSVLLSNSNGQWFGKISCQTQGAVSVDEVLLTALTPEGTQRTPAEKFVRTLHPVGVVQLTSATFTRSAVPGDIWHRKIDANVFNGRIRYDEFTYPIYDIRGRLTADDDLWRLDQFEGRNDSGRILCTGSWLAGKNGSAPLDLHFRALAVPMEEELQSALPNDAQYLWNQLQPSGAIDEIDVRLVRQASDKPVDLVVTVREDSKSNQPSGRSLRLYPRAFPYWLTDVACNITYSPGHIQIESASAANGASRVSVKGFCARDVQQQQWVANINWLPTSRLLVNNQLLQALPESIRHSLLNLDLRGPISVIGSSEIVLSPSTEQGGITSRWDCELDLEDVQLGEGNYVDAIRGTLSMRGQNDGKSITATGDADIGALTLKGVPVTGVKGPFALIGSQLFFGRNVSEALPQPSGKLPPDITADGLGGKLAVSGQGRLDVGKFYVKANLKGAELSALLQDVGVNRASIQGLCDAEVDFNGVPWNPQTFNGSGKIHLSDAKLYQLPFMVRLLSLTPTVSKDDSAFNSADIEFSLDGDRIPLQVACDGDVLRLVGKGWTNHRREIELELYTFIGRRRLIDPLLSESPYASAMMIEVSGTLDNLSMQRRPFHNLESTFQQMFPDVAERREANPILPWRR
jgi:AsmA-like C-terminal region/Protein of unknown function